MRNQERMNKTKPFNPGVDNLQELIDQIAAAEFFLKKTGNGYSVITSNEIDAPSPLFRFAIIETPAKKRVVINPVVTGYSAESTVFTVHDQFNKCFEVELSFANKIKLGYLTPGDHKIQIIKTFIIQKEVSAIFLKTIAMLNGKSALDLAFEKLTMNELHFALEKTNTEIYKRNTACQTGSKQEKTKKTYCIVRITEKGSVLACEMFEKGLISANNEILHLIKDKLLQRLLVIKGNYPLYFLKSTELKDKMEYSPKQLVSKL